MTIKRSEQKKRTITTNPQERAILFPILERATLNKPPCSSSMLHFARIIIINGRIGRREPCSEFLLQLFPCKLCQL